MEYPHDNSSGSSDGIISRISGKRKIVAIGLIAAVGLGAAYFLLSPYLNKSSSLPPSQQMIQQTTVLATPTPEISVPPSQNSYSTSDCYALEQLELLPKEQLYNTSIQDLINKILDTPGMNPHYAWRLGELRNYLMRHGTPRLTAENMPLKEALAQPITYTNGKTGKTGTPFENICVPIEGLGYNPGNGLVSIISAFSSISN
jgi:hypothetical protein